jgi:UDP-glucose 4-epimerase
MDIDTARHYFGLNFTIFRPHNVYGPGQNLWDPYRNAIAIFMRQCLKGEPITLFGDGEQTRNFSYIDDVAPLIAQSAEMDRAENEIINIGSDTPWPINVVAAWVAQSVGAQTEIVHLPERREVQNVRINHANLEHIFGVRAETPIKEGIQRMAAWARTQPLREPKPFAAIEVERGLPEVWRNYAGSTDVR